MPQVSVLVGRQHLEIGQCRVQYRVPVDEALAAVDQAFFVKRDEHLADGLGAAFVHRETVAAPVDRGAQTARLLRDQSAGFFLPLPDALDEFFAAELAA